MKKNFKSEKAITLVGLIVTIIILLILAGISIASLTGNGLFEKAKLAKEKQEEADNKEKYYLEEYEEQFNKQLYSSRDDVEVENKTDLWVNWLKKAKIDYTKYQANTILNNTELMEQLMSSKDAVDYMIESQTFLMPAIAKSPNAISNIFKSPYAKEKVLGNSEWLKALNENLDSIAVKVPTMTSDTTPSGQTFSTTPYSSSYSAFYAFDGNDTTEFAKVGLGECYIGYKFEKEVNVYKFELKQRCVTTVNCGLSDATLYYSDDGNTWTKASDTFTLEQTRGINQTFLSYAPGKHKYWKIYASDGYGDNIGLTHLQFYGIE